MMFSKKVVSLLLLGLSVANASVCKPKSGSCDECTTGLVGTATNSDGSLFCSNQEITTTDRGVQFPDGYVLWYQNIRNCKSPCFDPESEDSPDDDEPPDTDDEDEEGSDVCYTETKTCCPDSLSTVKGKTTNSGGKTYCVKFQAEEVVEGIFYTYPDGKTNTKWWKNIYPCEENRRGLCHYDESDDGPLDQVVILEGDSKGNANNACYPLDGGQTQCFDPTHPVETTCTPGISTSLPATFPGCCPQGIYIGTIPQMACSPSDAAGASGKLCYPLSSGTKCYDPGNPEKSTCTFSDGRVSPGCCPPGVTAASVPGMTCAPSDQKASSAGLCYPMDGGQTTCFDPTHPVPSTCDVAGKTQPGCCPEGGQTGGVVPGMTCAPSSEAAANAGNLCYPMDGGQTMCFDPTHPVPATCDVKGESQPGCCPNDVTDGYVPGMTCTLSADTNGDAESVPIDSTTDGEAGMPPNATDDNINLEEEQFETEPPSDTAENGEDSASSTISSCVAASAAAIAVVSLL